MAPEHTPRKIVIPGGSGHLGRLLTRHFLAQGDRVLVIGRGAKGPIEEADYAPWDGRTLGDWARHIDGADAVINLAGRSVDCRYHKTNLEEMFSSRTDSTRAIGMAIAGAQSPPPVWLQMSTATIYSHRFDAPNDEPTGVIGGFEADAPRYWRTSVRIAEAWERELEEASTPRTRKVAMRTAMVMSPEPGGPYVVLRRLARWGLGGPIAGGRMYMSWVHGRDFVRSVQFLLETPELSGPVNLAAPEPLPQRDFMGGIRSAIGMPLALPAAKWMIRAGAVLLSTDPELILKSRRVVPTRLLASGFQFELPDWPSAAAALEEAP